jgi:hypothetical protein
MKGVFIITFAVGLSHLSAENASAWVWTEVPATTVNAASSPKERPIKEGDLQATAHRWYAKQDPADLPAMDAALAEILPAALRQSAWITQLPTWEEAHQQQAYHDAGAVLLAKIYTLIQADRGDEAKESIQLLTEKLPHALMVSPDQVVWQVRKMVRYHQHDHALRAAVKARKMDTYTFPAEQDEFDAWAQKQTVEDLAMLQLRQGDFDSLDYLADQAHKRQLKTASGHWVSDSVYAGMHPVAAESEPNAWAELTERMHAWRTKKPDSMNARIGEALLSLYQLKALVESGKDVKTERDRAMAMLKEIGPVSPQIPLVQLVFSLLNQESLEVSAGIFKEAHEKFPTYTPVLVITLLRLTAEPNGHNLCIGVLNVIGESENYEQLALALTALPPNVLPTLSRGLKMSLVRRSLKRGIELYSGSLEIRNSLGLLATRMSQQDLAQEVMSKVGPYWDRQKWKGLEDQAVRLTEPKNQRLGQVTRPESRGLKSTRN